jgi:hypothetical protein
MLPRNTIYDFSKMDAEWKAIPRPSDRDGAKLIDDIIADYRVILGEEVKEVAEEEWDRMHTHEVVAVDAPRGTMTIMGPEPNLWVEVVPTELGTSYSTELQPAPPRTKKRQSQRRSGQHRTLTKRK